jgi:elongator complex protein 3
MHESHAKSYGALPSAFIQDVLSLCKRADGRDADGKVVERMDKERFQQEKGKLVRMHKLNHVPSDIAILTQLTGDELRLARARLRTKPVRTGSGVTVVAVMTKPLPCPHGKCTYCPGGPGSTFGDVPQSYTGNEPASMRGARAGWSAYVQVFNRLEQYVVLGHNPQKVELILMGGTFPSYDHAYQDEVIHDIFQAMDDFSALFYRGSVMAGAVVGWSDVGPLEVGPSDVGPSETGSLDVGTFNETLARSGTGRASRDERSAAAGGSPPSGLAAQRRSLDEASSRSESFSDAASVRAASMSAEDRFDFDAFKTFFDLPGSIHDAERTSKLQARIRQYRDESPRAQLSVAELQAENETAIIRCIGLTIETRPTHARTEHALVMLEQGCTRIELGVQTTFDDVLTKVHRDHTMADTTGAIADLRDLGFKLNFHVMLGMPLMTPERDIEAAHRLFDDPALRPDMLKLYPCMVMPGTPLYYDWKAGTYAPYDTTTAARVIADIKRFVPRTVRIMRVQRDIPTKITSAGVGQTNLRQVVDELCAKEGIVCPCIRCRESRASGESGQRGDAGSRDASGGSGASAGGRRVVGDVQLRVTSFDASGGTEHFLEYVDDHDTLLGFCRMRFPARSLHPSITMTSAIIRELHVYGTATGVGDEPGVDTSQHRGIGRKLMADAERLAREAGKDKMLVIAGVGVREYYVRLGYAHDGPYVGKTL